MPGDQVFPSVSLKPNGGYIVWEDNTIDGNGRGIAALRLDNNFSPRYGAFRINQTTVGDQEKPQVAAFDNGGAAIVWQGRSQSIPNIYARLLNASGTFTGTNDIRVNSATNSDQAEPALTVMANGNVFIVWSSRSSSASNSFMQDIRAQILTTNGTMVGTNFYINGTNLAAPTELYNQRSPAVATLANGNIVVAWVSENQGVPGYQYSLGTNWIHIYARLYNPAGVSLGPEFRVNTALYTLCANPAVAGTSDGGFTVVWSQRLTTQSLESWDVYGRGYAADGTASAAARRINSYTPGDQFGPKISAAGASQMVVWTSLGQDGSREGVFGKVFIPNLSGGQELRNAPVLLFDDLKDVPSLLTKLINGSDRLSQFLWSRFSAAGKQLLTDPASDLAQQQSALVVELNTLVQGPSLYDADRFAGVNLFLETKFLLEQNPQGDDLVRLNRFLLQDAYRDEIRPLRSSVNTTTISRQVHPTIASDGAGRFLVAWSSYGADNGFDLYAQRYSSDQAVPQPSAPFVSALNQYSLGVTWPPLSGFPLSYYEVYQDGSGTPTGTTTNNMWVANGLAPGSTHWFQWAFVLVGGQRSPLSAPATNQTWGIDANGKLGTPDGLPDDWQRLYFGSKTGDWDGPNVDSDGDGASNWQEFLAGTNPRDPNSVLKMKLAHSPQGQRLGWNTVAGAVYQVQVSANFETWSNIGPPRLAAGATDSMLLPAAEGRSYYRVARVQ